MQILLCAATEFEIAPVVSDLQSRKDISVEILITGVGMMAATYNITKAIYRNKPDMILQAGVAGALHENLPLVKTVAVRNEIVGDLGVLEGDVFQSIFHMGLVALNDRPWENGKLPNNSEILQTAGLPIVDAVTVNEISTDPNRIAYYREEVGADIETMEGAALHFVALQEKLPFLQMRCVSNFVGERNKNNWKLQAAIEKLNAEVLKFLQKFTT